MATSTTAADLLRTALDDAPEIEIAPDGHGQVAIWIDGQAVMLERNAKELRALVLLNVLLAASHGLADLLDAPPGNGTPVFARARQQLVDAILEAGESL